MLDKDSDRVADYIVVGAGSAGCVVANRLSAATGVRVLLLEAGGDDRPLHNPRQFFSNINIHIPAGFANLARDPAVNWNYVTEPDPGTAGRRHNFSRGKVLGGSSAINGLMYVRGLPSDYDGWRQLGCVGWGWSDVLPLFRRNERAQRGETAWQGGGGPLSIADFPERYSTIDAFIDACGEAGMAPTDNINGADQEGVCYTQQTTSRGLRHSTATAFLNPARNRANLEIETGALATRILFEGRRAVGVEYMRNGERRRARARREVILCGGAINSPQLLELSGIGDPTLLAAHGIDVVAALPAVGENLQDHLNIAITSRLKPGAASVNRLSHGLPLAGQMLRFALSRRGLLASSAGVATGYMRSRPELDLPDVQLFCTAASVDMAATLARGRTVLETKPGLTIGGYIMRPQSRGSIHIRSGEAREHPRIAPNYLDAEADRLSMISQIRAIRHLLKQPSLAAIVQNELGPLRRIADEDGEALLDWARGTGFTAYHPVGTCRMGADADSVVDPELRVRGVEGLRVADASIMPRLVSANTNAACIMIGEKLADMVRVTPGG
ncbi:MULTISPECIES: GMC family oxidoreductase [unclassified Sphingobium]|uniref:GMC family oxidoreductase n=1 Tax=unclassified Sphingobium TaxID=2611147 RepID=UPI000D167505|nr:MULTISPECIES: GMC family oxidoreductase N-terminal domain-containing protein [unclassified Sphingobium]MBG6119967.1 choline dehydrogenase [Sphingobium sp. JAI105]PSO11866.1 choline dehydrogenase [Sphingobium sp. AEW4]TWC99594.1 choline dehydrogenase [Sphingobium sp. AEW010]TWD18969.1 choline dehydrogenase [Sphingobium sp. AEW013]TWD21840.1 choline dehydrogenase [Sphingobium sp. AEW001]